MWCGQASQAARISSRGAHLAELEGDGHLTKHVIALAQPVFELRHEAHLLLPLTNAPPVHGGCVFTLLQLSGLRQATSRSGSGVALDEFLTPLLLAPLLVFSSPAAGSSVGACLVRAHPSPHPRLRRGDVKRSPTTDPHLVPACRLCPAARPMVHGRGMGAARLLDAARSPEARHVDETRGRGFPWSSRVSRLLRAVTSGVIAAVHPQSLSRRFLRVIACAQWPGDAL
jgi:hypothetical protein